jgi:hypothetical protein
MGGLKVRECQIPIGIVILIVINVPQELRWYRLVLLVHSVFMSGRGTDRIESL